MLIDVGGKIGAVPTVLLCVLTAAVGLSLVRMQGLKVIENMQMAIRTGEPVGENLIHGFFLLLAGVFLFIPGFVSDAIGGLLLIPFVRIFLGRAGLAHMVVRSNIRGTWTKHSRSSSPYSADQNITIDGEFKNADTSSVTEDHRELSDQTEQQDTPHPKN